MAKSPKAWFAPKLYGYGSGLPIAWQGWVILLVYMLLATAAPIVLAMITVKPVILISAILGVEGVMAVVLIVICARTTEGGWHWRWGGKP